jgi:hypothetical protein
MESLGAYLFAGAFRFLGHRSCPLRPARKRRRPNVLMEKRGKWAAIDALLPAGRRLAN